MPQSAEQSLWQILQGMKGLPRSASEGFGFVEQLAHQIAIKGYKFYFGPPDNSDLSGIVTGQSSFASTTPTVYLRNPATNDKVLIPLFVVFVQTGTVAGAGPVKVLAEIGGDRYSSGGTQLKSTSSRPSTGLSCGSQGWLNPALDAGYGIRVDGLATSADIEPAEGALQQYIWTPTSVMDILDPGYSLGFWVYSASAPGPSLFYSMAAAEVPASFLE